MTTLTVTLKNEHALRLLEELEQLEVLSINATSEAQPSSTGPCSPEERTFNAFSFPTNGWKFNRDEANER
ncbi:hypothetical protein [Hymenobacter cavernae]|uniref:Uncharacterized protein n=1 Tax=Hymenobacter cavernae TaxID=2044852 RepID=A0ABQ1UKB1_9BACT|nr:hypothetical protein [Hymenobacter cavernae]GGF19120.1 hypothetical protein GCM10011383_33300 [Hymenobacter cavernae]